MLSCHYVADNQRLSWLRNGLVVTSDTDVQDPLRYALRMDLPGQYDLVVLDVSSGVAGSTVVQWNSPIRTVVLNSSILVGVSAGFKCTAQEEHAI